MRTGCDFRHFQGQNNVNADPKTKIPTTAELTIWRPEIFTMGEQDDLPNSPLPTTPPIRLLQPALQSVSAPHPSPHRSFANFDESAASSSPARVKSDEVQEETPTRVISRVHSQMGLAWRPQRADAPRSPRMWPLEPSPARTRLSTYQMELGEHLSANGIFGYQIFVGKYGIEEADSMPHIFLASDKDLYLTVLPETPDNVPITLLRLKKSEPRDCKVFLKTYPPQPSPGTIIGPHNDPTGFFSAGWWVRDVDTGSVFNLTVAHGIKDAKPPRFAWSQKHETLESPAIDCPPWIQVHETSQNLRDEIQKSLYAGEVKVAGAMREELNLVQKCLDKRDWATVIGAGYGEYDYFKAEGGMESRLEDWAILRVRSDRIGKNSLPHLASIPSGRFNENYTQMGEVNIGDKCAMSGGYSGMVNGRVFDQYVYHNEEHDGPSTQFAIVAEHQGAFGVDGDSGSPIAMEDGRAGGIFVGGGSAFKVEGEVETEFHYGYMVPLTWVFERIRDVLGRHLELPSRHDLSRRADRDNYHLWRTGTARVRH
jgi:hypothetical protein